MSAKKTRIMVVKCKMVKIDKDTVGKGVQETTPVQILFVQSYQPVTSTLYGAMVIICFYISIVVSV
jgi:hypothetical protein